MQKQLNSALSQRQAELRYQTVEKIRKAIDGFETKNEEITIRGLMKETEPARSTFNKCHINYVLTEYGIVGAKYDNGSKFSSLTEKELKKRYLELIKK